MSGYDAIALGSIAGMMAAEDSRRAGNEFRALQEEISNRRVRVDASVHNLVNAYNRQLNEIANLKYEIAKRETVIAGKDVELARKIAEIHQLEFKLQDEIDEGKSSVKTIGHFLKAYRHYRDLLGIERGDPYDVPGYW